MSLFGAKKTSTFQAAKERMDKYEKAAQAIADSLGSSNESVSSGIGAQMRIARNLQRDPDGTATTSEIAQEGMEDALGGPIVLPRDVFNEAARMHNKEAVGHSSQMVSTVHRGSSVDEEGNQVYKQPRVYTIPSTQRSGRQRSRSLDSQGSSRLSSPPPTTDYGGSEISFPQQTQQQSTKYEGSILGFPPSAIPEDPFMTPREGAGIIARKYIQSEESQHATVESEEEGMGETRKVFTPIPRKFEISDNSDASDEAMTELEWRDEEPYMTPTKKGKKRNKGKGVRRPVTPERPIPNMPQTPSRRRLEADWVKPAERLTNEKEPANLEAFIGEYLRNTNGLRDFMVGREDYDVKYAGWCREQAEHVAARQNHTDAAVTSARKISMEIKEQVELSRDYDEARAGKLDERLSKIEKKLAKIAPVNMARTIENAMSDCMGKMVDQLTERVVKRFEDMAEESRKKDEIRRGKQVEAAPEEEDMSDIEFEPGVTFSEEENAKVERAIRAEMEVDEPALEQSKHAPVIAPGGVLKEFPRLEVGQVTILKKKPVVPAVPQQKMKEVKKPEVKEVPKGPKAGTKKPELKKPEVKKPEVKKPEEKKKETWAQRAAAPPPPKKQPGQAQQQQRQGERQKKGDGFTEVRRSQQKKEEMKPVPPGHNSMEKRRVTFRRDNGLPLSQKKDLDISSEVNRALFEAMVPYFVRIQGVTKNTRECMTTITTPGATADMLIRYREIVIKAARKVDAGIVDIETNELWEKVKMHGVNFDRYLGKKTGGGLE